MTDILDANGKKTGELCGGTFVKKITLKNINATSINNDSHITVDDDIPGRQDDPNATY